MLKGVNWGATIQLAAYRTVLSGLILGLILAIAGNGVQNIIVGPIGVAFFVAFGLICTALARMGVPFAGLGSLVCFFAAIGDPVLWFIERQSPGKLPVNDFGFFNRPVLLVYNT